MKKNATLLEKALAQKTIYRKKAASGEEIDLAIAWLQGRIGMTQAAVAWGLPKTGTVLYRLATTLRDAHNAGRLSVK